MVVPGNARSKVRTSLAVKWTLGFYNSHSQTFAHFRITQGTLKITNYPAPAMVIVI